MVRDNIKDPTNVVSDSSDVIAPISIVIAHSLVEHFSDGSEIDVRAPLHIPNDNKS